MHRSSLAEAGRVSASPEVIARAPLMLHGHHVRRLEGVVDFVDAHLDAELSLEKMATIAAISPFHFHRLFHLWSGETLNEFVRRRRLDVAAGRLRHCPDEKITAIALNCGFASPEHFARAFRERFGATPSRWREGGWVVGRVPANDAWQPGMPRVAVAHEPAMDVLFMRGRGDFGQVAPQLWNRFMSAVRALGLSGQPLLFMGLDDPSIVGPARCRMDACVQLPVVAGAAPPCPPPLLQKRLPARCVATLEYDGPSEDIAEGWSAMLTQWLPQSGYKLAIGPFFERYDPAFGPPGARSVRCCLGMPVEPRTA
ncbi:MAG: GyrI-like domain-containing protein [Vitreoscilla sp.]